MFKNIVIPVDLSDKQSTQIVFPTALNFVNTFGSKIHLVHIIPDFGMKMVEDYLPRHWIRDQKERYKNLLDKTIKKFIPEGVKVECYIGRGAIYDQVTNYSEKVEADLIIISAVRPQQPEPDYMLRPNASKIVRHSSVSVMVIRN